MTSEKLCRDGTASERNHKEKTSFADTTTHIEESTHKRCAPAKDEHRRTASEMTADVVGRSLSPSD